MNEVLFETHGRLGRIILNRPKALNAITLAMVRAMRARLTDWAGDQAIDTVLIGGAGERGLCAGGDIRALHDSGRAGDGMAETFWREEYELDALINEYPKPVIAIMSGLVMGGGVGISAHAAHRIVTPTTTLAMPECGIGFMPDVGGTWILANAPGELGTFAGLTGHRMKAADAILMGFADYFVTEANLAGLIDRLSTSTANQVADCIAEFAHQPGPAAIESFRGDVDETFAGDTVEQILNHLAARDTPWSRSVDDRLRTKSPTSLKVALATFRAARRSEGLRECLDREYRFASRVISGHDFYEGVRAVVIDKDQAPAWQPALIEDVGQDIVDRHLADLADLELGLAGSPPLQLL